MRKINMSSLGWSAISCLLCFGLLAIKSEQVHADGQVFEQGQGSAPSYGSGSPNVQKSDRFLPGEEVVTPTGQRLRVWSTEGPVPVQRAPEPFVDPSAPGRQLLDSTHIIVDEAGSDRRTIKKRPHKTGDSFDLRDPEGR